VRCCKAGCALQERISIVTRGNVWRDMAVQERQGSARCSAVMYGVAGKEVCGKAKLGRARRVLVWYGFVWCCRTGVARYGPVG